MKNIFRFTALLLLFPSMLSAQYSGGVGRGDAAASYLSVPLPVELVSFTAHCEKTSVVLSWTTATETNNYGFDVECKTVNTFTRLGFIEGHGTTNVKHAYAYMDNAASGKRVYRLKQLDRDGSFTYSKEVEVMAAGAPTEFALAQNFPNPFNPTTTIQYQLPHAGRVALKVYDVLGKEVALLIDENKAPGIYTAQFDGTRLSSGMYFYTFRAGTWTATKKLLLAK